MDLSQTTHSLDLRDAAPINKLFITCIAYAQDASLTKKQKELAFHPLSRLLYREDGALLLINLLDDLEIDALTEKCFVTHLIKLIVA